MGALAEAVLESTEKRGGFAVDAVPDAGEAFPDGMAAPALTALGELRHVLIQDSDIFRNVNSTYPCGADPDGA